MTPHKPQDAYVTGKRWFDLALFVAFAILMVVTSARLRVYYGVATARMDAHKAP